MCLQQTIWIRLQLYILMLHYNSIYLLSFEILRQWINCVEVNLKTTAFSFSLILVCCSVKISFKQVWSLQIKWLPLDQRHRQLFCKGTLNHLWLLIYLLALICMVYVQTNWLQARLLVQSLDLSNLQVMFSLRNGNFVFF